MELLQKQNGANLLPFYQSVDTRDIREHKVSYDEKWKFFLLSSTCSNYQKILANLVIKTIFGDYCNYFIAVNRTVYVNLFVSPFDSFLVF